MTLKEYCKGKSFKVVVNAEAGFTLLCFGADDSILLSNCTSIAEVKLYGTSEVIFKGDKKVCYREFSDDIFE